MLKKSAVLYAALSILLSLKVSAKDIGDDRIHLKNWEGIEVVWIQDERFPTYTASFYFADGAGGDLKGFSGETQSMFDLLTAGTRRFKQREIVENLEFYGANYGARVTHEYSTFSVSGLAKDMIPTLKKVCHLFADATFPKKEIESEKRRYTDSLKNLVGSHSALASRAFRELSMMGSPYSLPAEGKLADIKRLNQKRLKQRLRYFNEKVAKKIYLAGPKSILQAKSIINDECGWKGNGNFVRKNTYSKLNFSNGPKIYLVTVPKANQAQVRVGRFLNYDEYQNEELMDLATEFLGGGFTSKLMREIRVKRGLSYSASAFAGGQRDYGRAGISTFTANEKLEDLVNVIKQTLESVSTEKGITDQEFIKSQGSLAGSYPFRFERTTAYLAQLMMLDHREKNFSELQKYPELVKKYNKAQLSSEIGRVFDWNKQTIVVLGSKKLLKTLKKFGEVEVISYKKIL